MAGHNSEERAQPAVCVLLSNLLATFRRLKNVFSIRCNQHVNVVGHQNISVQITTALLAGLVKFLKIKKIILFIIKYRLTIITANNYMLRLTNNIKSGKTCP